MPLGEGSPRRWENDGYVMRFGKLWNTLRQTGDLVPCGCNAPTVKGIVIDPFFGVGTVGKVAQEHGRDWIGIEINADYADLARSRIAGALQPGECLMRTLAIRLEDDLHAQLGMIAKLEGLTLTDALLQAIDQWIGERRNNPELQARAAAILADIDREAATRRSAIEALLGNESTSEQTTSPTRRGRGTAKGDDPSSKS